MILSTMVKKIIFGSKTHFLYFALLKHLFITYQDPEHGSVMAFFHNKNQWCHMLSSWVISKSQKWHYVWKCFYRKYQFSLQIIDFYYTLHCNCMVKGDCLQLILYKAFWLVHNHVIKNFIGSFEKLSTILGSMWLDIW